MPNTNDNNKNHLEPRVARLETGLEILTRDVSTLASVVRDQGKSIEEQIHKLAIGVTTAAGPRKTDWATIISALMLALAIGSAVFWPLNQQTQENKKQVQSLQSEMVEHTRLDNHPAGGVEISHLEQKFNEAAIQNSKNLESLDKKLQRESELITSEIKTQISNITVKYDREIQNLGDRLIARLNTYDKDRLYEQQQELDEFRKLKFDTLFNKKIN